MDIEAWRNVLYVNKLTARFHERTDKYPTREQAIAALREGLLKWYFPPRACFDKRMIERRCLERAAAMELLKRLRKHPERDPVWIFYAFYAEMDDLIAESDHARTWTFCQRMSRAAMDFLSLLE